MPPPLRRLGQHFLSDPQILARIADALELTGRECVVEVGAGRGALTRHLAPRCAELAAIEVDRALIPILREQFSSQPHVRIIEGDALELTLAQQVSCPGYRLTGNVPYYITTPLIFHALQPPRPEVCVYLVQKEVAERASALPGSKTYGALSVNLQALVSCEIVFAVPAAAFSPRPKVDSAVLRLRPLTPPLIGAKSEKKFSKFVQTVFGQRRKQMQRILRGNYGMEAAQADELLAISGIEPSARPETVSVPAFVHLFGTMPRQSPD